MLTLPCQDNMLTAAGYEVALGDMIPLQWGAALDRSTGVAAEHGFEIARMKPVTGADGTHIFSRKLVALSHILHHEQGTPKDAALLLLGIQAVVNCAQRLFSSAYGIDHGAEFGRLQREGAVRGGNLT